MDTMLQNGRKCNCCHYRYIVLIGTRIPPLDFGVSHISHYDNIKKKDYGCHLSCVKLFYHRSNTEKLKLGYIMFTISINLFKC